MSLIPEQYIDSVVAIGVTNASGNKSWIGTGFLYGDLHELTEDKRNKYLLYLVTNKHVLEGLNEAFVKFNPQTDQSAQDFKLELKSPIDGSIQWVGHPDPGTDIAVFILNHKILTDAGMKFKFFNSDKHVLSSTDMAKLHILEGNFVYVLGFPMGILSSDRQYVFARSGIISRIKDLYEKRSKDYVIDATVFPGNSGGPVISKVENIALTGTKAYNESRLVGIIKAYIPYHDTAYSMQTKQPRITFEENSGLSIVEPSEKIIETINEHKKVAAAKLSSK